MLLFYIFLLVIHIFSGWLVYGRQGLINAVTPEEKWFTQVLDHFNRTDTRTWQQRYFVKDTFYRKGGPAFLLIGMEGRADPVNMINGFWLTPARKFGAICFMIEHRFYGDSHPTRDISVDNLKYLSSQQALADIANFITYTNKTLDQDVKTRWMTFGCSYAGALSAWMKFKYPHLVHGAVSSSAPMLAVVDFKEYYEAVFKSVVSIKRDCLDNFKIGIKNFLELASNFPNTLQLCKPIKTEKVEDISTLYLNIAEHLATAVQDVCRFQSSLEKLCYSVEDICNIMLNAAIGSETLRIAEINKKMLNGSGLKCLQYSYEDIVKRLKSIRWSNYSSGGDRQWLYQTCTEFGFFQTSNSNTTQDIFGNAFNESYFIKQCSDVFGENFDKELLQRGIRRTNMLYGGAYSEMDNVIFVYGSLDPWRSLGVTKSNTTSVILIEGGHHCEDMLNHNTLKPDDLLQVKKRIEDTIGTWLQ